MNKQVFIEADVILDLLCKREPFYPYAAEIFTQGDTGKLVLVTTSVVLANVFYILRKATGTIKARQYMRKLRILIGVLPVGEKIVDLALNSEFPDFEDAIQYFAARENHVETLLTRNVKDYKAKDLLVQTPEEYLKSFPPELQTHQMPSRTDRTR